MKSFKMWLVLVVFGYSFNAIAMDESVNRPIRLQNIIYVKTSDGEQRTIERWQINEMKVLLVLLEHQKNTNSKHNPLFASMINSEELDLVCDALNAISLGRFESFYDQLMQEKQALSQGKLRMLINAAQRIEAKGVSSFCLSYTMPSDMQKKQLTPYFIDEVIQKMPVNKEQLLSGNLEGVDAIAFSPDGSKMVTGSVGLQDALMLWDVATWKSKVLEEASFIREVMFSSDGSRLVSSGREGLMVWDTATWQPQVLAEIPKKRADVVALSPEGNKLVLAYNSRTPADNKLIVWDMTTGKQEQILVGHSSSVYAMAFSPDGSKLVSAGIGNQNNLMVWDVATWQPHVLMGHTEGVYAIAFSPDGNTLVSGGQNNLIVWDVATWQQKHVFQLNHEVSGLLFSPDGSKLVLVVARVGDNVMVVDVATWQSKNLLENINSINLVAFSPDGSKLVLAHNAFLTPANSKLIVWDMATWQSQVLLPGHPQIIDTITFSSDSSKLVSAGSNDENYLIIWSLLSPKEIKALKDCTFEQAQFLYEIILAAKRGFTVVIKSSYKKAIFNTLPEIIKDLLWRKFHIAPMVECKRPSGSKGDCVIF